MCDSAPAYASASSSRSPLDLPVPVLIDNILPLLSNADLGSLASVSRQARALSQDEILWKRKAVADFKFPPHATARVGGWRNLYRGLSNPDVYIWGQWNNGRLGTLFENLDEKTKRDVRAAGGVPYPIKIATVGKDSGGGQGKTGSLVEIVAGGWSFHARSSTGKVRYWGTMDGEQFAGPHSTIREPGKVVPTPQLLDCIPAVVSLSGGRCHVVALTDKGEMLEWRAWGTIWKHEGFPPEVIGPRKSFRRAEHTASAAGTAANDGELNDNLNQGSHVMDSESSNIKQLEAGWSFSAVLTHDGQVWLWYSEWSVDKFQDVYYRGNEAAAIHNLAPQGHEDDQIFPLSVTPLRLPPIKLDHKADDDASTVQHANVVQIAAGEDFTIALTDQGTIYRLNLQLEPPTAEEWPAIQRLREQDPDFGGRTDFTAKVHRIRMEYFLIHRARWEPLSAFSQPQSLSSFQDDWLKSKIPSESGSESMQQTASATQTHAKLGGISHISAHFRRFVTFHPIQHTSDEHQQGDERVWPELGSGQQDTIVLLGHQSDSQPEVIPELQASGVIKVTMGDYHFGALTQSGDILTWGSFSNGALGNWTPAEGEDNVPTPTEQGEGGGSGSGWSNLIPLPRIFSRGPTQPRVGFAGRGASRSNVENLAALPGSRAARYRESQSQTESSTSHRHSSTSNTRSTENVARPARICIPSTDSERTCFAYDIAFAGWHSSALVMQVDGGTESELT